MPKPKLYKTIFQVKYRGTLSFYDRLMTAAQKLGDYEHWQTNRLEVRLSDFEKHCSYAIAFNSFSYEQDSNDAEQEREHIARALEVLPPCLGIESFLRVGIRRIYLRAVDMTFQSLVTVLGAKFLSQNQRLRETLPGQVEDLLYRVDVEDGTNSYHFTIGPVKKEEIANHLVYNQENHLAPEEKEVAYVKIREGYPDVSVFMDIDCFRAGERLTLNDAMDFVEVGRERLGEQVHKLDQYIFTKSV